MHWQNRWHTAGFLGVMVLSVIVVHPVPLAIAETQMLSNSPITGCTEERGQTLERLTRNLIYRSQHYARSVQFDLAARSLERALHPVRSIENPFTKTDLVANIAGSTGERPSTLEQIIDHAISTQQPDLALNLLPEVVKATQTLDGEYGVINSKQAIFIQLAHYYTLLNKPTEAQQLLNQARQLLNSLHGDGFGLIAAPVANGYAAIGDNQAAIEILNQALQRTEAMATDNLDYLADIFHAIATAYANAGAESQALQVAKRIQVPEVKARTLASIARNSAQSASSTQVTQILAQALNLVRTLPEARRSGVLSQITLAYSQARQWDAALEMVDKISSAEIKVQTLAKLASVSHRANRPEAAARLLGALSAFVQTIEPFYEGDTLLRRILAEYLENQEYELAFQFSQTLDATLRQDFQLKLIEAASAKREFDLARRVAAVISPGWKNQTRSLAWRLIATGYAGAGQFDQAIQFLPLIEDTSEYPNRVLAQVAIAQFYRKNNQPERAIEQLNQALQTLQTLNFSAASLEAFSLIAVQFAQLGQPHRALEVQTQALQLAKAPHQNAPSILYGVEQWLTQYLKAEEYALALQLVETLEDEAEHDRQLQSILQQMLEVGEWQVVRQMAEKIRDPRQKIAVWVKLSDFYLGMGQMEQATEILGQALATAQRLAGPDEISFADAARLDPSLPIRDEFDRGSLITSIAIRYAELGQNDRARQAAQTLRSPSDRQQLMQRLTCYP
ncbi:tetratricopeptide repeat protein [Leptothermofonsia sichuanensis E412]|uniref:tetratricopeptide repeat protein n=1 Tax=Leptothermofonsia sichuanensis TaxID=2917832 RepID=UPI001CA6E5DC|nr:tetratricopeptide repeat protein [Leptothermofonsia sichuanensis]QZZ22841.1 tetratricopeptide repeat protein [Leptothermofonsia sichuanensis E412]